MHTFRTFLQKISDAAFSPDTYSKHLKEKTSTGLGYLYWLLVCSFTIMAIVLAALYVPARVGIRAAVNQADPAITTLYPQNLVLTLKNGQLSTNSKRPTIIDPEFWTALQKMGKETKPTHFITIDTRGSLDNFASYDTVILVTKTDIATHADNQLRAYSLSEIKQDAVINKKVYDAFAAKIIPVIHMLPKWVDVGVIIGLILLPFVGAGFSWAWHLLTLLLWSLIFWAISGMMGRGLRYGQIYRLSLYALTLPIILSTFIGFLPGVFPLLANIVYVVFMIIVLIKLPRPTMPAARKTTKVTKAPKKAAASRKKAK